MLFRTVFARVRRSVIVPVVQKFRGAFSSAYSSAFDKGTL